ncbi:uncharacterized protein [Ptychodera flava]
MKFGKPIRSRWTVVTIMAIWLITSLLMLINLLQPYTMARLHLESDYGTIERQLCRQNTSSTFRQVWTTILFVSLTATLIFTFTVAVLSLKSGKFGSASLTTGYREFKQMRRMTKIATTAVVLFALAWLPLALYVITVSYDESVIYNGNAVFTLLTLFLVGFCNSFINPCVYAIACDDFRSVYKKTARAVLCRGETARNKNYFPEVRRSFNKERRNSHLKEGANQTELQSVGVKETRSTMAGTTSYPPDLCLHANGNINHGLNLDEVTMSDNFDSYIDRPFAASTAYYPYQSEYNPADERRYHSQYFTPLRPYDTPYDHREDRKRYSLPARTDYKGSLPRRVSMEDKEVAAIMSQEIQRMKRNERTRQVGLPAEYQSNILATIRPLGETPRDNPNFRRLNRPETQVRDSHISHAKSSYRIDPLPYRSNGAFTSGSGSSSRTSSLNSRGRYYNQQVSSSLPPRSDRRPHRKSREHEKRYDSSDSPPEIVGRRYQREHRRDPYDGNRVRGRAEMRTSDFNVQRAQKRVLRLVNASGSNRGLDNHMMPRYYGHGRGMESTTDDDDNRSSSESSNCSCSSPCSECGDESPIFSDDDYTTPKRYCLSDSDFEFHTTEYDTEQTCSENEFENTPSTRYQYYKNSHRYPLETVQEEPHYLFVMKPRSAPKAFVQLTEPVNV